MNALTVTFLRRTGIVPVFPQETIFRGILGGTKSLNLHQSPVAITSVNSVGPISNIQTPQKAPPGIAWRGFFCRRHCPRLLNTGRPKLNVTGAFRADRTHLIVSAESMRLVKPHQPPTPKVFPAHAENQAWITTTASALAILYMKKRWPSN
ncbi:hypothetical protein PQR46_23975 [Paraburkholderia sediminicola]|uniref:hypothetical protein n=1 Tax=Paraburkholderia TaxID=1822464 RepID=UPI0038BC876C